MSNTQRVPHRFLFSGTIALTLVSVISCDDHASKSMQKHAQLAEQALKKRQTQIQKLKSLPVDELARQLEAQSEKGIDSWNSLTYSEVVNRGPSAAPALANSLKTSALHKKADHSLLLGLLALRKIGRNEYRSLDTTLRVDVLTDSLKQSKHFNTWGFPHGPKTEAAQALIDEGNAAKPALNQLLNDNREAPTRGSEDFLEYKTYHYRVKDYAETFIDAMEGKSAPISKNPVERDKIIRDRLKLQENIHPLSPIPPVGPGTKNETPSTLLFAGEMRSKTSSTSYKTTPQQIQTTKKTTSTKATHVTPKFHGS